jgi:hypothetical protein
MPTTTFYLEIIAVQDPFSIGVDGNNRAMYSCNYVSCARSPADRFTDDLISVLTGAGIASAGVDTFTGSVSVIPPQGVGPFTLILKSSGYGPDQAHDNATYTRPAAQIIVFAASDTVAESHAYAIFHALHGIRNTSVTSP